MNRGSKSEIIDYYQKYFYTKAANTNELKEEAYKLRYKVYFEELSYKGLSTTEDQEIDPFDDYAIHSLLFYKPTDQLIACTRLVPFIKNLEINLPIESSCRSIIKKICHSNAYLKPDNLGELSRFLISPEFRCGYSADFFKIKSQPNEKKIINQSFLLMCIVLASYNLLCEHKIKLALAIMEPRLATKLKRLGMAIEPLGEAVFLYGIRKPYQIDPEACYQAFKPEYKLLSEIMKKEYDLSMIHSKHENITGQKQSIVSKNNIDFNFAFPHGT